MSNQFAPRFESFEDPYTLGITAGVNGRHYLTNPYNPKTNLQNYQAWRAGWGTGRTCLEFDNPAGLPVRLVKEEGVHSRLIPIAEKKPMVPGFKSV